MKKASIVTLFCAMSAFTLLTSCEKESDLENAVEDVGEAVEETVEEVKD